MEKKYAAGHRGHRLRREIIARVVANDLVNRGGPSFVTKLQDEHRPQRRAKWCAPSRWCATASPAGALCEIDALDNKIDGQVQLDL
jgi:glutamate dehydrogenase